MHKLIRPTVLAKVLDEFRHAVTLTNTEDQFVYANPAFTKAYGWEIEEIIGMRPLLLMSNGYSKSKINFIRQSVTESKRLEVTTLFNRDKNGRIFEIELATFGINLLDNRSNNLALGISAEVGEITQAIDELMITFCRSLYAEKRKGANEHSNIKPLAPHDQIHLLLRCGYSTKEIAGYLGVHANTPNVILHRARRK